MFTFHAVRREGGGRYETRRRPTVIRRRSCFISSVYLVWYCPARRRGTVLRRFSETVDYNVVNIDNWTWCTNVQFCPRTHQNDNFRRWRKNGDADNIFHSMSSRLFCFLTFWSTPIGLGLGLYLKFGANRSAPTTRKFGESLTHFIMLWNPRTFEPYKLETVLTIWRQYESKGLVLFAIVPTKRKRLRVSAAISGCSVQVWVHCCCWLASGT